MIKIDHKKVCLKSAKLTKYTSKDYKKGGLNYPNLTLKGFKGKNGNWENFHDSKICWLEENICKDFDCEKLSPQSKIKSK